MCRRCIYMRGFFILIFVVCFWKYFLVFFSLDLYQQNKALDTTVKNNSFHLSMEVVRTNFNDSESFFHQLVKTFYNKYNNYYRRKLAKSLNDTSKTTNVVDKSGIIPSCGKKPFLLIQVHSTSINVKKRLAIRHSWGMTDKVPDHPDAFVRVIFVVGRNRLKSVDDVIFTEAQEYQDILLTEFFDSYRRLSHKTLLALKWATNYCRPQFMLKTDDDCYVNIPNIVKYLHKNAKNVDKLYTGRIQWFMPTNRNRSSKFYTSQEDYQDLVYPPYAAGGGYLFSGALIPQLVNASSRLAVIPNEDAYFGTLMHAIGVLPKENNLILPFIYCNETLWERPSCDFLLPFVVHGALNYAQLWIHYHINVMSAVPGICKQSTRNRHKLTIPFYCHTDLSK